MTQLPTGAPARLLAALALAAALTGCAAAAEPAPPEPAPAAAAPRIVAVGADRVVVLDSSAGTLSADDRSRGRLWTHVVPSGVGSTVSCLAGCGEVVLSGGERPEGPDPVPVRLGAGGPAAFPVGAGPYRRVLAGAGPDDLLLWEGDASGHRELRILGRGRDQRVPTAGGSVVWAESPDGSAGVLVSRPASGPAEVRRLERDARGWRPAGVRTAPGPVAGACVGPAGRTAILTGSRPVRLADPGPAVLLDRRLAGAVECRVGDRAAVLVRRLAGPAGDRVTVVHLLDADGRHRWQQEIPAEAAVAAAPTEAAVAVVAGGQLRVLRPDGQVVRTERDVLAAAFDPEGGLVVVRARGAVDWLPAPRGN